MAPLRILLAALLLLAPALARASTCGAIAPCCDADVDPGDGTLGPSEQACVDALSRNFGPDVVRHEIFHTGGATPLRARDLDNQGRLAKLLPGGGAISDCRGGITGEGNAVNQITYVCDYGTFWGCDGGGAGSPACAPPDGGVRDAVYESHYNGEHVDQAWLQTVRPGITGDGDPTHFVPSQGLLFDLGGASNKVAVFAVTDHGPFPCESFEYEVFVTDDPSATEIADPAQNCQGLVDSTGAPTAGTPSCTPGVSDPTKWNRTTLYKAFLAGWDDDPLPDGGTRYDPDAGVDYVGDGYAMVFTLPCGVTFRYASLVPGNAGNPAAECQFYSSEYELDAVAGLNQDETSVCQDADRDGYPDCACTPPSESASCDCDDSNPAIHPGAPEDCGSDQDYGCLGGIPTCPSTASCVNHACVQRCLGGELGCPNGQACVNGLCGGQSCQGITCGANEVCSGGTCVDPCAGAVCPPGQDCRSGACVNLCAAVACPEGQVCAHGQCAPSCACLASACSSSQVCDPGSGLCVSSGCAGVACGDGLTCVGGTCLDTCSVISCPTGTDCDAGQCVHDPCFNVICQSGSICVDGTCQDACTAAGHPCPSGSHCSGGVCVAGSSTSGSGGSSGSHGATGGSGGSTGAAGSTGGSGSTGASTGTSAGRSKGATASGCGCSSTDAWGGLLAALGLALRRRGPGRLSWPRA